MSENILLEVSELKKYFPIVSGFFNKVVGQVRAVDGVSFSLFEGECLGLVGESGSGKTTVGRTLLRAYKPTDGEIRFHHDGEEVDIARASEDQPLSSPLPRPPPMRPLSPCSAMNPLTTSRNPASAVLSVRSMALPFSFLHAA